MGQTMGQLGGNAAALLNMAPRLIAKVIAMVTGSADSKEVEEMAANMSAADQLLILGAMQRLTFPRGLGPFVDEITKFVGPMPTILSASTGAPVNSSQEPSSASLQTESPGMTRGRSPRAN